VNNPRPKHSAADAPEPTPTPAEFFVCLPRAVCLRPPLRHRGQSPQAGLSVAEFCLASACACLARRRVAEARHQYSLRAGREALRAARKTFSKE
jgi:hypothetical protein